MGKSDISSSIKPSNPGWSTEEGQGQARAELAEPRLTGEPSPDGAFWCVLVDSE